MTYLILREGVTVPFSASLLRNNLFYLQFSLMENDMTLLKQLLQLGDQISEIKKERLRRTMSQNSLEYDEEDEKEVCFGYIFGSFN